METLLPENEFILLPYPDLSGTSLRPMRPSVRSAALPAKKMIGQPHNMVRHPDMPEAAFADMWRDLKAGRRGAAVLSKSPQRWRLLLELANAPPVRENGQVVGYRRCAAVRRLLIYRGRRRITTAINAETAVCWSLHGRAVARRSAWMNWLLSLRAQMQILGVLVPLLGVVDLGEVFFKAGFRLDSRSPDGAFACSMPCISCFSSCRGGAMIFPRRQASGSRAC